MKKKRKQSFNQKKTKNNTNKNSKNKTEKQSQQQPCCSKNVQQVQQTKNISLPVEVLHRANAIVKKTTFLLKRDSMILNDCLKPQWMQLQELNFKQIGKYKLNENDSFCTTNIKNIIYKQKNKKQLVKRILNHLNSEYIRIDINVLNRINLNYELISLKFKFDYFQNRLQISIEPHLNNVQKSTILNFKHENDLKTEIFELYLINLLNLNEKMSNWFELFKKIDNKVPENVIVNRIDTIETFKTDDDDEINKPIFNKKPRPSYLIERDCHIFGGCVDDEAMDEFFISSGAVYQSWPYVYEPGFRLIPLLAFEESSYLLSRSDNRINYSAFDHNTNAAQANCLASNSFDELPSYSLNNFEINLFHVVDNNKKHKSSKNRKKKQRLVKKKQINPPVYNENNELVYSSSLCSLESCYLNSSFTDDEDDSSSLLFSSLSTSSSSSDDSESFKAYKKRHEIGLNNNNLNYRNSVDDYYRIKCCSQMSLSDLRENNLTDSSSFENNYNRRKNSSNKSKLRLTNSCNNENTDSSGLNCKMKRFLSQRNLDFWNINEENFSFRNHHHNNHQRQVEEQILYSDQLIYC